MIDPSPRLLSLLLSFTRSVLFAPAPLTDSTSISSLLKTALSLCLRLLSFTRWNCKDWSKTRCIRVYGHSSYLLWNRNSRLKTQPPWLLSLPVSLFPSSPYLLIPEPEGKTLDSFSVTWWNCNQSRNRNSLSFLFLFFSDMTWFTYFFFFLSFSWNWLNSLLIRQNYWRNPISLCLCLRLFLGLTIPFPEPFFIN